MGGKARGDDPETTNQRRTLDFLHVLAESRLFSSFFSSSSFSQGIIISLVDPEVTTVDTITAITTVPMRMGVAIIVSTRIIVPIAVMP